MAETLSNKPRGHNINRMLTYGRKLVLGGPKKPLCPLVKLVYSYGLQDSSVVLTTRRLASDLIWEKALSLALPHKYSSSLTAPPRAYQSGAEDLMWLGLCHNHRGGFVLE